MMILFDFLVDENELAKTIECDPLTEDQGTIKVSSFYMPVRLNINGIEFFNYEPYLTDPWINAPLIGFAIYGLQCLKNLPFSQHEMLDLIEGPEELFFDMIGNENVLISQKQDKRQAVASYQELLSAFQSFSTKVRAFLNERVPEMREHSELGPWVRGEWD